MQFNIICGIAYFNTICTQFLWVTIIVMFRHYLFDRVMHHNLHCDTIPNYPGVVFTCGTVLVSRPPPLRFHYWDSVLEQVCWRAERERWTGILGKSFLISTAESLQEKKNPSKCIKYWQVYYGHSYQMNTLSPKINRTFVKHTLAISGGI